ncbi:MAG: NAD-dependent deacetylase [Gemmatimonadota bacterium]
MSGPRGPEPGRAGARPEEPRGELERARALLAGADEVLVLTGAGISADSGIPTFRGPGGLWRSRRPEEMATPEAFERDPRLVWEWYGWRREVVGACRPNAAHLALARWALRREGVRIVTQNVDGLHTAAAREVIREMAWGTGAGTGTAAERVPSDVGAPTDPAARAADAAPALPLQLHGSLFRSRCPVCRTAFEHREPIDASSRHTLPHCGDCGGLLRPDVVWFGEALPKGILDEAFDLASRAGACLVVGTSAVVQPAASLATVTLDRGGAIVELNPDPTPLTRLAEVSLRGRAAELLPELLQGG